MHQQSNGCWCEVWAAPIGLSISRTEVFGLHYCCLLLDPFLPSPATGARSSPGTQQAGCLLPHTRGQKQTWVVHWDLQPVEGFFQPRNSTTKGHLLLQPMLVKDKQIALGNVGGRNVRQNADTGSNLHFCLCLSPEVGMAAVDAASLQSVLAAVNQSSRNIIWAGTALTAFITPLSMVWKHDG